MRSRIADQQMTSFPDSFVVGKILTPSRSSFLYHPTRFLGPSRPRHTCAYPQSGAMVGPGSAVTPRGSGALHVPNCDLWAGSGQLRILIHVYSRTKTNQTIFRATPIRF